MVSITSLLLVAFFAAIASANLEVENLKQASSDCQLLCNKAEDLECLSCVFSKADSPALAEFMLAVFNIRVKQGCKSDSGQNLLREYDMTKRSARQSNSDSTGTASNTNTNTATDANSNTGTRSDTGNTGTRSDTGNMGIRSDTGNTGTRSNTGTNSNTGTRSDTGTASNAGTRSDTGTASNAGTTNTGSNTNTDSDTVSDTNSGNTDSRSQTNSRRQRDVPRLGNYLMRKIQGLIKQFESMVMRESQTGIIFERMIGDCSEQCSDLKSCDKDWVTCVWCLQKS